MQRSCLPALGWMPALPDTLRIAGVLVTLRNISRKIFAHPDQPAEGDTVDASQ